MAHSIAGFGAIARGEQPAAVPAIVQEFLNEHFEKISAGMSDDMTLDEVEAGIKRMSLISDVNGTLDFDYRDNNNQPPKYFLDEFACDLHARGIPVHIMSGVITDENIYSTEVAKRLSPSQSYIGREPWFHSKPLPLKDMKGFGMIFEDEESLRNTAKILGVTVVEPCEFYEFLEAWHEMSPAQKDEALAPWVQLHERLVSMKAALQPDLNARSDLDQK
jgi:hypothetical protein